MKEHKTRTRHSMKNDNQFMATAKKKEIISKKYLKKYKIYCPKKTVGRTLSKELAAGTLDTWSRFMKGEEEQ